MTIERRAASVVFVLGLLAGAALGSWGQRLMYHRRLTRTRDPKKYLEKLTNELKLDDGQKSVLLATMTAHKSQMDALKKDCVDRYESIRGAVRSEIAKSLTPEQRVKYEAMVKEADARREREGRPRIP